MAMQTVLNSPDHNYDEVTPRDYQIELFQAALDENIIVYLPTGSGKTFVAALLIKEKAHEITRPLNSGGKRTVFLVPTIVLAVQQAAYLQRHTHLKVKEFHGNMAVDMWGKGRWLAAFEETNVLVMTAQIFVEILNHAYFSPHQLNLLIFDECHAAVKDAPMRQVLSKLQSCEIAQRPKILGLTAALFRKRCKPRDVLGVIQHLSDAMGCVVRTPSDIETVYRSSTKPCEIIFQFDDENEGQNEDARDLTTRILEMIRPHMLKFVKKYGDMESAAFARKQLDKIEVLWDALKDISFLLVTFGPYGAFHCAQVYIPILLAAKGRARDPQFASSLEGAITLCKEIRALCTACFAKYSPKDRLIEFVQPIVIRLLEIIKKFSPQHMDSSENERVSFKMCGIIFVERRCMADMIHAFLQDIRKQDTSLEFVKPLFTMGQAAAARSSLKESDVLDMNQKEIMRQFHDGRCNLLVATSVLEEGVDIPACNLIIRFDKIKTYCDYVQTKGRARSTKAFYCMMVSKRETDVFLQDLAQFHAIEQQLLTTANFEEDRDCVIDSLFSQIIEPYTPFGVQGPRITLQSSISLVSRYCSQFMSYAGVVFVPQWDVKEVDQHSVDPTLLKNIKELLKQLPYIASEAKTGKVQVNCALFRCHLRLPQNSPLKEELIGQVMPTKRLAKRAVALSACIRLHKLKELDDIHLLPITRNRF